MHAVRGLTEFLFQQSTTFHKIQIIIGTIESIAMIESINVEIPHQFLSRLSSLSPPPDSIHEISKELRKSIEDIVVFLQPLSLFVDASKNEAGAILFDGQETIWTFNQLFEIEDNGSTFREAHALLLTLQALPRSLLSSASRLNTDNIGLFHSLLNNSSDSNIISSIVVLIH